MRHEQPAVQCTQRRREVQGTGQRRDGAMHRAKRGAMHQTGERGRCSAPNKAWCNAPRENGCNAPREKGCNAPREKREERQGERRNAPTAEKRKRGRRNAPNAERETEGAKPALTEKATSPQRDLSQGAMGGVDFSGKVLVVSALPGGGPSVPYLGPGWSVQTCQGSRPPLGGPASLGFGGPPVARRPATWSVTSRCPLVGETGWRRVRAPGRTS